MQATARRLSVVSATSRARRRLIRDVRRHSPQGFKKIMKPLVLLAIFLLATAAFAMSPPMRRENAPQVSAMKAIEAATAALASKPGKYYCAKVILQEASMNPDPLFAARHWQLVFYEEGRKRTVDAGGKETFGDIELNVSAAGEIFGMRQLFSGPFPKNP
jgi:hypothetical protein